MRYKCNEHLLQPHSDLDSKCPKWSKNLTFHQKYARPAQSLLHGARNGRRIGTMFVFVQTVAAGRVDAGCADIGLKANGCV